MDSIALTTAASADSTEPELAFIRGKISRLLRSLDRCFIERETQIRLALLALLCGHHVLLLGPPGTAKSLLARALCASLHDATFFEYLLSKFTHPDELFGPVSIPGLKEEDYRRLTEGYLPSAHIAFLDEIFKANSAILNSLLTLINERVFHHGKHRDQVPLIGIVGASNEPPDPEGGLGALYDRFLVRVSVPPIADPERFLQVCLGEVPAYQPIATDKLTRAELEWLRERARSVGADEATRRTLLRVREKLIDAGVEVSDRRWRWALELLKMSALTSGRTKISPLDVTLLEHCFGDPGGSHGLVRKHVRESLLSPDEHDGYLKPLRQVWAELATDAASPDLTTWRRRVVERLDRFDDGCKRARGLLDRHLEHVQQELTRTPWCTELPPELLAGLVAVRTKLQVYERGSAQHRAAVAAYGPASLLLSRMRQVAQQSYGYYGDNPKMWVRAPTDAVNAAVGLNGQGHPMRGHGAPDAPMVIDDAAAHRLLVGGDASTLIDGQVAQWLVQTAPQPGRNARREAVPQYLTQVLEGLREWAQQHASPHVPRAPSLEAAAPPKGNGGRPVDEDDE